MKNIVLFIIILTSPILFGQTGISTQNPKVNFHVDGKNDNLLSTATELSSLQQANDFVVTSTGWVGVGTVSPSTSLEIKSAKIGAVQIVDGTQGDGKILTSDADGVGTWKASSVANVTGTGPTVDTYYGTVNKYMNGYITLPQGKWFVYLGFLVNGASGANTSYASRLSLSSSPTLVESKGFTFVNNNSSLLTQISNGIAEVNTAQAYHLYGMFSSGIIRVDVSLPSVNLYLWNSNSVGFMLDTDIGSMYLSNNTENYLFAIRSY